MMYSRPPVLTADKSLPKESIVMMLPAVRAQQVPAPTLPEGYSFRLYQPGDAALWARIAVVCGEYDDEAAAEASFQQMFLSEEEELRRRCVFVIAPDGTAVATSMAWMLEENGRRYARMHWVMNDPAHQGKGIGRAVVTWMIRRLCELEPGLDQYLDTQTWSHKAIGLYLRIGIRPVRKTHPVLRSVNDYDEAVEVLRGVLPEEMLTLFVNEAID